MSHNESVALPDQQTYVPPDGKQMRRRVLGLAWPVIAQNLLETMLGIVDTALVANLGAAATAGVGSAQQIMFFVLSALSALSIGSSVLVAQAIGARNVQQASQYARQSLVWSVLIAIPFALLGVVLAPVALGFFRLEPAVLEIGVGYLQVTMGTVVVLIALFIGSGVLRGTGDSRTPMVVSGLANLINAALAYGLIYGQFGLPALGAVGSAWATFAARAVALTILLVVLWRGRNGVSIRGRGWLPKLAPARQMLQIGLPAAVEQILTSSAFLTLTLVVAGLGTATLAGNQIAFTALSASFLPGFGFGIAATTLVGQSVGARRIREGASAMRIALGWAVAWMTGFGILIIVFAIPILRVFTNDPQVIQAGAEGLRVVALQQPFWGIMMVISSALRGTGDTRFPLIVGSTGMWAGVGLAILLTSIFAGGLGLIWGAYLVVSPIMGLLYWYRFRQTVERIAADEQTEPMIGVGGSTAPP